MPQQALDTREAAALFGVPDATVLQWRTEPPRIMPSLYSAEDLYRLAIFALPSTT